MWQTIWQTVASEFSDIPDVAEMTRISLRLLVAALLGGVLGFEREMKGKGAGLRTHMLVALGAAFFVLIPQQMGASVDSLARVMQGVIAGVGFLGAGAIMKRTQQGEAKGLTTAAGIWLTAAIGVAVGLGREATAVLGTLLALVILWLLPRITQSLERPDDESPAPRPAPSSSD